MSEAGPDQNDFTVLAFPDEVSLSSATADLMRLLFSREMARVIIDGDTGAYEATHGDEVRVRLAT